MKRIRVDLQDHILGVGKQKAYKYDIDTLPHDPKLPAVFVFSGNRGSGKTYACVSLCQNFEKKHYTTRTFLLCPTRESNPLFEELHTLSKEDTCENSTHFLLFLRHVLSEIKKDWQAYTFEKMYTALYTKWKKGCPFLTLKEEKVLELRQGHPPQHLPKPSHMIIVDDAQSTSLFSNARENVMSHIVIKHRHIPTSICFLMQSWMGLPRTIRLNGTHFLLYKTQDLKQVRQLYEAFGNLVTWDQFLNMYKTATSTPHGFLYIDTVPKQEAHRFKNGFNEYMMPPTEEEKG